VTTSEEFVPVKDVAQHFGVTPAAIYKWVDQGRIAARRLGRAVRITRDEFDFLKAHGLREPATITDNKMTLAGAVPW
jgi:excisionase family DNA binding protein